MKKLITLITLCVFALAGCGVSKQLRLPDNTIKNYPTYGFFTEAQDKSDKVCYEFIAVNLIPFIIFIETVIVPIYIFGWDLWEPVRLKHGPDDKCGIDG